MLGPRYLQVRNVKCGEKLATKSETVDKDNGRLSIGQIGLAKITDSAGIF